MPVQFKVAKKDMKFLEEVVNRAQGICAYHQIKYSRMDMMMDLVACHSNGNPLDFKQLSKADDANLGHDVFGIWRYLDRNTGKLTKCFCPRFSMPIRHNDSKVHKMLVKRQLAKA